ncbi:MAG: methionyl-tRNA formyltransferase [Gammaproteobacteria bacterium]
MRIVFAGTPEFAVPPLAALVASRHQVVGVLTQPDRPAGRGRRVEHGAVKEFALAHGLPVAQPVTLRTAEGRAPLAAWGPDVMVVVAYGLILPPEALALPRFGCLNIHASLLPRWRGAAPIQRALLAGDPETGVAIMQMDAGLDTGPVLLERRVTIGPDEDSPALHARLAALGAAALLEALDGIEAGTLTPQAQSAEGATYAAKLDKSEARIDWREDAAAIARRVRALRPWPVAETLLHGEQVRLHRARALPDAAAPAAGAAPSAAPGALLGLEDDMLVVACGRGRLGILELQRAGRRSMTAREFANGLRAGEETFT